MRITLAPNSTPASPAVTPESLTGTIPATTTTSSGSSSSGTTLSSVLQAVDPGLPQIAVQPVKLKRSLSPALGGTPVATPPVTPPKCAHTDGFHDHHVHLNGILSGSEYVHMLFQGEDEKESFRIAEELYKQSKISLPTSFKDPKKKLSLEEGLYAHPEQSFTSAYGERRNLNKIKIASEQNPLVKTAETIDDPDFIKIVRVTLPDYADKLLQDYKDKSADFTKAQQQKKDDKLHNYKQKLKSAEATIKGLESRKPLDTAKLEKFRDDYKKLIQDEKDCSNEPLKAPPINLLSEKLRAETLLALVSVKADGRKTFNEILKDLGFSPLDDKDPRASLIPIRKKMISAIDFDAIDPSVKGFYIVDADTSFKDTKKNFRKHFQKFYENIKAKNLVLFLDKDPINRCKKRCTGRLVLEAWKLDKDNKVVKLTESLTKFKEVILIAKSLHSQKVRVADIAGQFDTEIHPRFIQGVFASAQLDAKILLTYTSKTYLAAQHQAKAKKQKAGTPKPLTLSEMIRKDFQPPFNQGIDFLGREPKFSDQGMENLKEIYNMLSGLPDDNKGAKILRIHGGEGFGLDSKEDVQKLGKANIRSLLNTFSSLSKSNLLQPNKVELRIGHFTHCTTDDLFEARHVGALLEFNLLSNLVTQSIKDPSDHPFLTSLVVDFAMNRHPTFTFGTDGAGMMGQEQRDKDMASVYRASAQLLWSFIQGTSGSIMLPQKKELFDKVTTIQTKKPLTYQDLTPGAQKFMTDAYKELEKQPP